MKRFRIRFDCVTNYATGPRWVANSQIERTSVRVEDAAILDKVEADAQFCLWCNNNGNPWSCVLEEVKWIEPTISRFATELDSAEQLPSPPLDH